jgi:MFS family permease
MQVDGKSQKLMEEEGNSLIGKLGILALLAVGLLMFPPLSILAPVPFAFAALTLGRLKGMAFAGFLSIGITLLAIYFPDFINPIARGSIFLAVLGLFLAEMIFKKIHPIRGFISVGIFLNLFFGLILGVAILGANFSPKKVVYEGVTKLVAEFKASDKLNSINTEDGEDARAIKDMINNPQSLVDKIVSWLPAGIFVTIFFTCWLCFYVILRNSLFWRQKVKYPFGIRDFLRFKVPDFFVYPLIIALVLTLGGEYLGGNIGTTIGGNLLYCLGVFYFFHGLGIFVDLLDYLKVHGLLRTLMFAITFIFAWRVLVIAGVFDLWVNFRKFFNKNNNLKK